MRVFVYEHICGGGLAGQELPASLAREGWAMLSGVVQDFATVLGVRVHTTLDERLARSHEALLREAHGEVSEPVQVERIAAVQVDDQVRKLAAKCDWTLLIAPEIDGILAQRCRWVEAAVGRLLGPSPAAVDLAADKFALDQHLKACGVPAIGGVIVRPGDPWPENLQYPAVLKPRFGAGSQQTFLIRNAQEAAGIAAEAIGEGLVADALVQPFVPGQAASVSFLVGPYDRLALVPASQRLSNDGRFHYQGGRLPLEEPLRSRAVSLGRRAVEAVPGLLGYVGVDLVLAEHSHQALAQDVVVEINPRLTTSYVGLRMLADDNLARLMLDMAEGRPAPPIRWKPGTVTFDPDGRVNVEGVCQ